MDVRFVALNTNDSYWEDIMCVDGKLIVGHIRGSAWHVRPLEQYDPVDPASLPTDLQEAIRRSLEDGQARFWEEAQI